MMIHLRSDRVFVFLHPIDMRKSFDSLASIVSIAGMNPRTGDLFVFANKRRNRCKVLVWESGGYWVCAKRFEEGVMAVPFVDDDNSDYSLEISLTELRLLIEGIELRKVKKNKRFVG